MTLAAHEQSHRFVGRPGDFDFLIGTWRVNHRRLRQRNVGSADWLEFTGRCTGLVLLNGMLSVDEFDLPALGYRACTVRTLDVAARQWSLHWVTSQTGVFIPPMVGGFDGERGEFYGDDVDNTRPVRIRFVWYRGNPNAPAWEQAFSLNAGATWETNWVMRFERADPAP